MTKQVFFILFGILMGSLSAQNFIPAVVPSDKGKINSTDTLNILAVMVEFAKDNSSNTFGDGTFGSIYTKDYGTDIIDPLPHDKDYFEAHLNFAKDYYSKASGGKLNIDYQVVPEIIKLPKTMLDYTTEVNSNDLTPLANFAGEVWHFVDSLTSIDFSRYDLFVIFHAGVGRDVNLPGSLGLERDIPSVYLGENALKNIFGDNFSGFDVNNGNYLIKNSAILPETESRELNVIGGSTLIELSINGLLVAHIGSHLGLPDLFDTKTGKSAIGRFGLMDGQSIFAYGGLFPPMPSAWERVYLGWADVIEANSPAQYSIKSLTEVIKIQINENEYYLVENRNRDAQNDGANLRVWLNGQVSTTTFSKDQDGFYSFDISGLNGVVTSVDEYDWALPGNGILIWHIDEQIINSKLSANEINADIENRGVDLEEADGIQDIGVEFTTIFGDVVIGEGDSLDFWYSSNPSELYTNEFDQNTKPNTNSNDGAKSLVRLFGFSDKAKEMSFALDYASGNVSLFNKISIPDSTQDIIVFNTSDSTFAFVQKSAKLYSVNLLTGSLISTSIASDFQPAVITDGNDFHIYSASENNIYTLNWSNNSSTTFIQTTSEVFSSHPVIIYDGANKYLFVGSKSGNIFKYEISPTSLSEIEKIELTDQPVTFIAAANGYQLFASGNTLFNNFRDSLFFSDGISKIALTKTSSGSYTGILLTDAGRLFITDDQLNSKLITENVNSFALGDIKNDGNNHIVFSTKNKVFSASLTGSIDASFPFASELGYDFTGNILVAEMNGDEFSDIITTDNMGNVFVIDGKNGNLLPSFPISLGDPLSSPASLFVNQYKTEKVNSLLLPLRTNFVTMLDIKGATTGKYDWASEFANNHNSSFIDVPPSGSVNPEFFPDSKVYNWPNPVYGGDTFIHYYVSEDSKIEINIFDLSGELIEQITDNASGGFENETKWNVDDIGSGVYFAHVKAIGSSGKSETKIIKIAVIH